MSSITLPIMSEIEFIALRRLWRGWDPIGVFRFADETQVEDEYDDYIRECHRLIAKANKAMLISYLESVVVNDFGLSRAVFAGLEGDEFASRLMQYQQEF